MLQDHDVAATVAVTDIDAAQLQADGVPLGLCRTNKATANTWAVDDQLEFIVQDLRSSCVSFEDYDLPGTTRDGDIYEMGGMRGVWLKDPDSNIIGLVNQ